MQKSIGLFLSVILCFSLHGNQAKVLKKLAEKESDGTKSEQKEKKYEGNSLVYNLCGSIMNGIKGEIFAEIATPCTGGLYAPYSVYRFSDLLIKKLKLCTGNAEQFGDEYCRILEKETALRELTNRGAKAVTSVVSALALYKWASNLREANNKYCSDALMRYSMRGELLIPTQLENGLLMIFGILAGALE